MRTSQIRRGRKLHRCAGGSTLVIAIGKMAMTSSAPATAEKPPAPRLKRQLSARGSGEVRNLIERVKRAAIGVGRLGVDPGLDHRIKAHEHQADQRAAAEPGPLGEHDWHQDYENDRERHERRKRPDVAGAANDSGRRESSRQHAGEIDRAEQADREIGEALDSGSQRRRDANQAVAADQHQHGQKQRGD